MQYRDNRKNSNQYALNINKKDEAFICYGIDISTEEGIRIKNIINPAKLPHISIRVVHNSILVHTLYSAVI